MRYFLISDNQDTLTGMRLAGIEGVLTTNAGQVTKAMETAFENPQIAIVLITKTAMDFCPQLIEEYKQNRPKPLILVIPDPASADTSADSISRSIQQAIGITM
jgi:V/A-type H+-transporting ATPase subunit F